MSANTDAMMQPKAVVLSRIEICIQDTLVTLSQGEVPSVQWHNFSYHSEKGKKGSACASYAITYKDGQVETKQTFVQLVHLLQKIHCLLRTDAVSTTRDLYYQDVKFWKKQDVLDGLIILVSKLLGVPRCCLNITATAKGLIAGDLSFENENGRIVQCDASGMLIPQDVESLTEFRSNANFILVIEKDATFQKLLEKAFEILGNCILVTGKGFPDQATRRLLKRLWEELRIPIFALVDADPHGISIMCTYRYGSETLKAEKERLAVPAIRWLGIHPRDIEQLQLPENALIPLSDGDIRFLEKLKRKKEIQENGLLVLEIENMLRQKCKVEIQGLTKLGSQYLLETYISNKIVRYSYI